VTTIEALAAESVDDFAAFGIRAFTTGRGAGNYGMHSIEPAVQVTERWAMLRRALAPFTPRLATAGQVHGARVVTHDAGWEGWLRVDAADGHATVAGGTGMAVTIADCVPVFLAHPSGATAILHSGWRGTAARIVEAGIAALASRGVPTAELRVHLGPAICGDCYEVSADVFAQLTGRDPGGPRTIDLRALIAEHARRAGAKHISTSPLCTRCHNDVFFSHRAGDAGRQLAVIVSQLPTDD
jgi:polyphenol oxidase